MPTISFKALVLDVNLRKEAKGVDAFKLFSLDLGTDSFHIYTTDSNLSAKISGLAPGDAVVELVFTGDVVPTIAGSKEAGKNNVLTVWKFKLREVMSVEEFQKSREEKRSSRASA